MTDAMQILEVVPWGRDKCKVLVDEGFAFALYRGELREFGIEEGKELPEPLWSRIQELLYGRAKERSLYLLKDRARTEAEIARKLREGFYPEPVIGRVLGFLREYRLVDDEEYGRRYVEIYGQSRSARWIQNSLRKRGLTAPQIEQALEQGNIEEGAQIEAFLRRKHYDAETAAPEEKRKIFAALLRRGYSYEVVSKYLT